MLATASASAATSSSVTVTGPKNVQAGQKVRLDFTGYAGTGVHRLRVWLDDHRCATSAKAEGARPNLHAPTQFRVSANFKARLTIMHSSAGTHVVCAYLLYRSTQDAVARGSWRYVTR
jgi:hypothetical protein